MGELSLNEKDMNVKTLNREDLQALFDRFACIQNENKITLLGAYLKQKPVAGGTFEKYNPNYKFLHIYDKDEQRITKTIPTSRIFLKIPSANRVAKNGQPFTTNIPLFTSDNGVDAVKAIDDKVPIGAMQYVICKGAVQNFYVTRHASPNLSVSGYMKTWMEMYVGKYDEKLASKILQILRMSLDVNNGVQLPMLNVRIHNIADGTELAKELQDRNQIVGFNNASITGLVYMPPSLCLNADGKSGRLHFKVRVKRRDIESQSVPIAQQAKDGYDIINVICFSKDVAACFENIQQGYPVKVEGSLENYKFVKKCRVNYIEQKELAELFDVDIHDNAVQDIVNFVENADIMETAPSYNILAKEIRTDYENW